MLGGGGRAMASRCACFTNSAVFWKILCSSLHLTFHPFALYNTYCIYYCLFVYMLYPIRDVAFGINELNCIYWTVRMASNRYPLCEYQKFRTRNILDYISNKHIYCKIEKVPRGIRGEKSSKDMASSRNLVSTIGALASPKMGDGTRCPEG